MEFDQSGPEIKQVLLIRGLSWPWDPFVRLFYRLVEHREKWDVIADVIRDYFGGETHFVPLSGPLKFLAIFFPSIRTTLAHSLLIHPLTAEGSARGVIAHSFGAVILARAFEIEPEFRVDRIVLFNAPLRTTFPWQDYVRSGRLNGYRNICGKKDFFVWPAAVVERITRRLGFERKGLLGAAGLEGFSCCSATAPYKCPHNRHFKEYGHLTGINVAALPQWLYFLGLQPRFSTLKPLSSEKEHIFGGRELVPSLYVDIVGQLLERGEWPVLVEGPKGSGKSANVVLAAEKLFGAISEGRAPIYYLNALRLRDLAYCVKVREELLRVPKVAVLILDDLHRAPETAISIAIDAIAECPAKLLFVSRSSPTSEYEFFRRSFTTPDNSRYRMVTLGLPREQGKPFQDLIHQFLRSVGKPDKPQIVEQFAEFFGDDLTALFDAVAVWQPGDRIVRELADSATRERLEEDPDFDIHGKRDRALAAFLTVAAFWQFEREVSQSYLADALGLNTEVARTLVKRHVLEGDGKYGNRRYHLDDHTLRARRYIRVASTSPDYIEYLRQRFRQFGLKTASAADAHHLTGNILLLEMLLAPPQEHAQRLGRLNQWIVYGGYQLDYLAITQTLRENLRLLPEPSARIEVLVQGGSIRRRAGQDDDARQWLQAARDLNDQSGGAALGRILYEEAYFVYNRNEFDRAAQIFQQSADLAQDPVGQLISQTKSFEARFQARILEDPFARNLGNQPSHDFDCLSSIRASVEQTLEVFETLAFNDELNSKQQADAARWVSNCLLHLTDICIEAGDLQAANSCLRREKIQMEEARHLTIEPVVQYLEGRLSLLLENRIDEALNLLLKAQEGYKRFERVEGQGDLLVTLGDVYQKNADAASAKELYKSTVRLGPQMRNGRAHSAALQRLERIS